MRFLYILIFLSFINFSNAAAAIDFQKITVEKAILKAQTENKKVLIYFTAGWCGPCKWMEQNTFKDQTVVSLVNAQFISIKVDIDSWKSNELKKQYNIAPIPAFVILKNDGTFVNKIIAAQKPTAFINFLNGSDSTAAIQIASPLLTKRLGKWAVRPGAGMGIARSKLLNLEKSHRTNFRGGLFLSFDNERFMIKPGINFLSAGTKSEKLNYLQVPIDLGFKFIKRTIFGNQGGFKIIGGPYYSLLLNGHATKLSKKDYGLSYGLGIFMGSQPQSAIDLIFKVDQGLNDVYPQILEKQHNQVYSLSATLTLGK